MWFRILLCISTKNLFDLVVLLFLVSRYAVMLLSPTSNRFLLLLLCCYASFYFRVITIICLLQLDSAHVGQQWLLVVFLSFFLAICIDFSYFFDLCFFNQQTFKVGCMLILTHFILLHVHEYGRVHACGLLQPLLVLCSAGHFVLYPTGFFAYCSSINLAVYTEFLCTKLMFSVALVYFKLTGSADNLYQ